MKIIGMDGYGVYVKIDKEDYPKLVKALAMLDADRTENDSQERDQGIV